MKVVGIEAANSFVKVKSRKGETAYLNTVREHFAKEESFLTGVPNGLNVFRYDGSIYTVGDIHDYLSSSSRDGDKYDMFQYKLENLLGIAQHVDNGDRIRVVTGLPSEHYSEDLKNKVISNLQGRHTVYVNTEPRTFEIVDVKVILQPLGTLTYLLIDENGYIRNEGVGLTRADKRTVIVDIGWGTTDIALMQGPNLVDYFGIDTAMLEVYEQILDHHGLRSKLTPFQAEYQLKLGDDLEYGGIKYPTGILAKEVRANVASSILTKLKNRVKLEEYDAVIFTGGGVSALYENIRMAALSIPNALPIQEPQMANARGYYAYGISQK